MTCKRDDRFTIQTPESWQSTLGSRVIDLEDRGREIESRMGFRPYSVWVIRTGWAGGRRGDGPQTLLQEVPILPAPKVSDLTGVTLLATPAMVQAQGTILLSEVSGRYTEDQLQARDPCGRPDGPNESVWWEVQFLHGCAAGAGERLRFQAKSLPMFDADRGAWSLTLVHAYEGRARNGSLR